MSFSKTLSRHYKIISLLQNKPRSFKEINDELANQQDATEDLRVSQRTFQRDIQEIAQTHQIEIASDKSKNVYYIKESAEDEYKKRLRENYDIINAIRMSKGMGESLFFEQRKALGTQHMADLLNAIQNRKEVKFKYQKFWDASLTNRIVKPIALKESKNRWYLIAKDTKDNIIKNFSLDRMSELQLTKLRFTSVEYNIHEAFENSFGIINGTNDKVSRIILAFKIDQGRYIKSLPLHHSQKLISQNDNEIRFEYQLKPTFDFIQEILSHGSDVEVIAPLNLRKMVIEKLKENLKKY
ncbi:Predicted DNA-binding transcriptional regulator YafY, contains an HTH and WYL domains [Zunongwangia mangrovi]|uniref:Predicted DNA-binding transcriptional regulator YafY, contains an HTH and WYL domains n=1 Tax=Zunongwangia mangrovi TaxID=1334022 RepID=A0A1I1IT57_9FLAO|nr:WYL domain-containing protein [Zunongwangia mangrovi]SFC39469.1 Predicted DNA-binding transcriptional regulator YafY, contains an HTH and WYL domains [Zunongwangia mangrovi]